MAAYLLFGDTINESTSKVYTEFQRFLIDHGVVTTSAGVIVGLSTYTFVRSASIDMFMPLMDRVLFGGVRLVHKPSGVFLSKMFKNVNFHWLEFIQELVTWLVTLFLTFFVLQYLVATITLKRAKPEVQVSKNNSVY